MLVIISLLFVSCSQKEGKKTENKGLTVGFVYYGPVGDGGWNYTHSQGKIEIEDLPFIDNVYNRENAQNTETALIAIEELVKMGANLIFTTSYEHKDATILMAKKYPKVIFESCSTFIEGENIGSYFGHIDQAWYLAGIIAGSKTESNKIGVLVAHANPECIRITNAFALGVKQINPEAIVYAEWIHNWFNPSRENEVATSMINMGCDVITHNTDANESQRVADNLKVYSIGYNSDMKDFTSDKHLTSVIWNWGVFYQEVVTKVHDGKWKPEVLMASIDSGIFGLSDLTQLVTPKERELVNDFKEQIVTKELHIYAGEITDNKGILRVEVGKILSEEELLTIDWLVENIKVLNPIATN